ncbi:MAG: tetratricopeptide repeat protein [Gammaproteobacteria bacterium]|jgi:tetratricopeptide (TPR) repeat protein|nr:tetratricopeptide repeat protein [Gammaproteobacteria bacterium]
MTARSYVSIAALCTLLFAGVAAGVGNTWDEDAQAGVQAYLHGDYAAAERHLLAALRTAEEMGPEDPRLALSLNNLALVYHAQGRYDEAEPVYKRAISITERALGPDHPNLAASLGNLAELYRTQKKYVEAEPLYREALMIWQQAVGSYDLQVALWLEDCADVLRKLNRNQEAAKMEARANVIRAAHTI